MAIRTPEELKLNSKFKLNLKLIVCAGCTLTLSACASMNNFYKLRCWERDCLSGQKFMRERKFKSARREFNNALRYAENDKQIYLTEDRILAACLGAKDYESALALVKRMLLSKSIDDSIEKAQLLASCAFCLEKLKQAEEANIRSNESIAISRQILKNDPRNYRAVLLLNVSLRFQSALLRNAGKEEEAEKLEQELSELDAALKPDPVVEEFSNTLAECKREFEPQKIIEKLAPLVQKEAIRINTGDFRTAMSLVANAYAALGDDKGAVDTFNDLMTVMKKDPFCFKNDLFRMNFYFARDCLSRGRFKLCLHIGKQALESKSAAKYRQLAELYFDMAIANVKLENRQAAFDYIKEAHVCSKLAKDEARLSEIEKFIREQNFHGVY